LLDVVSVYVARACVGVVEDQTEDLAGHGADDDLRGLGFPALQAVGEQSLEVRAHCGQYGAMDREDLIPRASYDTVAQLLVSSEGATDPLHL